MGSSIHVIVIVIFIVLFCPVAAVTHVVIVFLMLFWRFFVVADAIFVASNSVVASYAVVAFVVIDNDVVAVLS